MYDPALLTVWFCFQTVGGIIGMPIMLVTLAFSSLKRLKTLYNLLLTWIATAVISNLLFFAGRAYPDQPEPSYELCLLQSAMIYGAPPLLATSALALIYETWLVITGRAFGRRATIKTILLGVFASTDLGRERHFFYCSFRNIGLSHFLAVFTGVIAFVAIGLTIRVANHMYHSWQKIKMMANDPDAAENAVGSAYVILRIALYGADLFLAFVLCGLTILIPHSPIPDLLRGSLTFTVFLIFGTQKDILMTWLAALIQLRDLLLFRSSRDPSIRINSPIDPPASALPLHSEGGIGPSPISPAPSIINSFTVWKRSFLDRNKPPPSVWIEEHLGPDPDAEERGDRGHSPNRNLDKVSEEFYFETPVSREGSDRSRMPRWDGNDHDVRPDSPLEPEIHARRESRTRLPPGMV
ncbi:hypothetical protein DL93DRAFT_2165621 [Clavulina sp. PMI_390]|nr:hypothetical protein DL93DRAFT_2165621 [Clavulina sp. PMI_390]